MRPQIGYRSPLPDFRDGAGAEEAANDNQPGQGSLRKGLRSILIWHIGVFAIGGGFCWLPRLSRT